LHAQQRQVPPPPGTLVDIGGQHLHLNCTGHGSPTVLLENGLGDFSMIWALVQPQVSGVTKVCSYDRAGYAWSEPGARPRTFAQLSLELRTALRKGHVDPPYLLVGQSYGGLVIRGFYRAYPTEVSGMVMVDAVHEDQRVIYGGQPHRIRDGARGRQAPPPRIALDTAAMARASTSSRSDSAPVPLEPPLDRLPAESQMLWQWAASQAGVEDAQQGETDWSPEELARMHQERLAGRATLGDLPLIVLARQDGGYEEGMEISADSLERERRALQADLAALSRRGTLQYVSQSGHNIHLEQPDVVIAAIRELIHPRR
jgi:pimeloyl-ACP methyl ester carboxylesterase